VAINLVEGGRSPNDFGFAEMQAIGVARVSLPLTTVLGAIQGMRQALAAVRQHGGIAGSAGLVAPFADLKHLVGFDDVFALEKRHLAGLRRDPQPAGP
jgi:methylisocitrate lyase